MADPKRLTGEERGKLILWIEANQGTFIRDGVSFQAAARRASKYMGAQVTGKVIRSIAANQSLRWVGSQVKVRQKKSWRCQHCGGRCITKVCQVCKLRRSRLLNVDIGKAHGTRWAKTQLRKGASFDGRHNQTK